jgi:hypothetical protein
VDDARVGVAAAVDAGAEGDAVNGGGVVDGGVEEAGLVGDGDGDDDDGVVDGVVVDGGAVEAGAEAGLVGGVEGTWVGCGAAGAGACAGAGLAGDDPAAGRAAGADADGRTAGCTGAVGEAGGADETDEGAAGFPVVCGGRLFTRPAPPEGACFPRVWPETPPVVPVTGWAPVPLGSPPLGSCDDGAESRGTKSTVPCRNPGHTNASNSSAASSPAPDTAAGLRAAAAPAARRRASGASRGRPGSGTARKSRMTCSFSSVPASIGSSSAAHWPVQSSRRRWQVRHRLRCRVTVTRRATGSTAVRRRPSCRSASR